MKRSLRGVWFAALMIATCGCAPEFWDALAQGAAAQSAPYAPSTLGDESGSEKRETVCVKYQTDAGWSHGYQVSATIVTGSELNKRTKSYHYDALYSYAVIFWDQGEASVLQLDIVGQLSDFGGVGAVDQRGRKWNVAKSNSSCY